LLFFYAKETKTLTFLAKKVSKNAFRQQSFKDKLRDPLARDLKFQTSILEGDFCGHFASHKAIPALLLIL
jgi:hypothetical protein